MNAVSGKAKRLCRKLKSDDVLETNIPPCAICGGNGSQTAAWQDIEGLDPNYQYSIYRTVTKKVEEMSGAKYGESCCCACKDKYTGQWRQKYINQYVNKNDKTRHTELMNMSGVQFSIAAYNDIMAKSMTNKIKGFAAIGIDYNVVQEAIELSYYNRYVNCIGYISLEEYRRIDSAAEYIKYIVSENMKKLSFMQFGDETVNIDFITKQSFFITDFNNSGNDKFREFLGESEIVEVPDYHHFLLWNGKSAMKSAEPALMLKTDILEDQTKFIESMGLIAVGKTTHKRMHNLYKNFDIVEALKMGIAPKWAQSENDYKTLQKKYPGIIDDIGYEEMLSKFTLTNYPKGKFVKPRIRVNIS